MPTTALAFGAIVACSSAHAPAMKDVAALTTVTGTVGPATLRAVGAIARRGVLATPTPNNTTATVRGLRLLFSDKVETCSAAHAAASIQFAVTIRGGAVGPSTYDLKDPSSRAIQEGEATADLAVTDTACRAAFSAASTGGTVTITATNPRVTGYLDVAFATGEIEGPFDAELCPALEAHDDVGATDCAP